MKESKRESRNIGFEADMLVIFKFQYNFFFIASLSVYSERLTSFHDKTSWKFSLSGGVSI